MCSGLRAGALLDLVDADRQQLSLLDTPQSAADRARSEKLMTTMDELSQKMGRGTLRLGMPTDGGAAWRPALCQSNAALEYALGRDTQGESVIESKNPSIHAGVLLGVPALVHLFRFLALVIPGWAILAALSL